MGLDLPFAIYSFLLHRVFNHFTVRQDLKISAVLQTDLLFGLCPVVFAHQTAYITFKNVPVELTVQRITELGWNLKPNKIPNQE